MFWDSRLSVAKGNIKDGRCMKGICPANGKPTDRFWRINNKSASINYFILF